MLLTESALTNTEAITVISSFNSLSDNRFNCATCLIRNTEEHREKKKFCSTISDDPIVKYQNFFTYFKCPGSFRSSWAVELIMLHGQFEGGQLPYEGGILDQPAKYIEVMRLISSLKFEHQKDLEAKAKKWQTTKSQSNSPLSKRKR